MIYAVHLNITTKMIEISSDEFVLGLTPREAARCATLLECAAGEFMGESEQEDVFLECKKLAREWPKIKDSLVVTGSPEE